MNSPMHCLERLISSPIIRWVLLAKICTARSRKVFHGNLREIDYGRGQTFDYRPIRTRDAAIVVTCPKCKCCAIFVKATVPHIDSAVSRVTLFVVRVVRACWPKSLTPSTAHESVTFIRRAEWRDYSAR